jgi:hemerythrin superfamily protein
MHVAGNLLLIFKTRRSRGYCKRERKATRECVRSIRADVSIHSAHEDTVVFQTWKSELSEQAHNEMQQIFAETERNMIGNDGFNDALNRIVEIETTLGIADLSKQTMPMTKPR